MIAGMRRAEAGLLKNLSVEDRQLTRLVSQLQKIRSELESTMQKDSVEK